MSRIELAIAIIGVVLLAAITYPMWYAYGEKAPLTYINEPFPLDDSAGPKGRGIVSLIVSKCNNTDAKLVYLINRELVDVEYDIHYTLINSVDVRLLEPGCTIDVNRIAVIPESVPPGIYELRGLAMVVSPRTGRQYHVVWQSAPFRWPLE